MISLFLVLASIALLDSTSMIPLSVMPIALILGGNRPFVSALGFIVGIVLAYFCGGLLLMYGFDAFLERIEPGLLRWFNDPSSAELLLQFIIGIAMLIFSWKSGKSRGKPKQTIAVAGLSPGRWFSLAIVLTLGGLPGAIPYLGAIDQILRADLPGGASIFAVAFYNLVFILPIICLFLIPRLFPAFSETFFPKIIGFFGTWGPPLITLILALLGLLLVIDAVTFYLGHPLLPVYTPGTQAVH